MVLQPAVGAADLCVEQMVTEGILREDALARIWMMDGHGLLVNNREFIKSQYTN